jgi:hypothetical protein
MNKLRSKHQGGKGGHSGVTVDGFETNELS